MAELPDRADLLARVSGLEDAELERVVEMLDAGVFLHDPPILEDRPFVEYADEDTKRQHLQEIRSARREAAMGIAALPDNPSFQALADEVRMRAEQFWSAIARGLAVNDRAVNQRELDYRRGFYRGAIWAVHRLPAQIERARVRRALLEEVED